MRCERSLKTRPLDIVVFSRGIYYWDLSALRDPTAPAAASGERAPREARDPECRMRYRRARSVRYAFTCVPRSGDSPHAAVFRLSFATVLFRRILIHETPPWHVGKSYKAIGAFALSFPGERTSHLVNRDNDITSKPL